MPEKDPAVTIPLHCGLGLASLILGALCIPLAIYIGVKSFAIQLPAFGIWYFLPVVVLAIVMGMLASRTVHGVAGAALGVVALLICMGFIVGESMYGPQIRAQLKPPPPATTQIEQLLKMTGPPATKPAP